MKTKLLPSLSSLLIFLFILAGLQATAQEQKSYAYAVTADTLGGLNWNVIRAIDLKDGTALDRIGQAPTPAPGVRTEKNHAGKVAACAFDKATHRLFFATMHTNELFAVNITSNNQQPQKVGDLRVNSQFISHPEQNNVCRMVIGPEGQGYALTNDANHFFVFSTTGKLVDIKDKGPIKDASTNGQNSIHDLCTGWGGDMIADKYGFLYLVNIYNRAFKIDVKKMEASFLGNIQGLPQGFYTNGTAVDEDGKILLSCSTYGKGYFHLDINTLKAVPITNKNTVFNASDLASGNLLFDDKNEEAVAVKPGMEDDADKNSAISVWPNPVPVSGNTFNVVFNAIDKGDYIIQLVDMKGNVVANRAVRIGSKRQTIKVQYGQGVSGGLYIVKVISSTGSITQTSKKLFVL